MTSVISPIAAPDAPQQAATAGYGAANAPANANPSPHPSAPGPAAPPNSVAFAAPAEPLNPKNLIDQALGIDVVEYVNGAGQVTQSFPSQKQLATYRLYGFQAGEPG